MKKIIRILFVCLFFIALIFIGKNVLKDGKEREYIKSDKYYEENIENININEVNFKFLQVNEVANVNEAFYKKYDSYKEVVVEDNKNYDVFEKYTKVDVAFDQGYSGMRCYLNEDESFGGAYFRYTFEYETNDENLVDSSIEVYITAEPLEKFEGLLPTIEEADEGNVYSIYDNILYYMETVRMPLYKERKRRSQPAQLLMMTEPASNWGSFRQQMLWSFTCPKCSCNKFNIISGTSGLYKLNAQPGLK